MAVCVSHGETLRRYISEVQSFGKECETWDDIDGAVATRLALEKLEVYCVVFVC